jgi:hypothetical protein
VNVLGVGCLLGGLKKLPLMILNMYFGAFCQSLGFTRDLDTSLVYTFEKLRYIDVILFPAKFCRLKSLNENPKSKSNNDRRHTSSAAPAPCRLPHTTAPSQLRASLAVMERGHGIWGEVTDG